MNTYNICLTEIERNFKHSPLYPIVDPLAQSLSASERSLKHGHLVHWRSALEGLPSAMKLASNYAIEDGKVIVDVPLTEQEREKAKEALKRLMPWRKGPFRIAGINIDTEWRSDFKWDRLAPHISPLKDRTVLDVGCGSGYHLWRMHAAGAKCVLGIDPSLLFLHQFLAIQHFAQQANIHFLPLGMEALPAKLQLFQTVFSMGVLYHRRNPHEHLIQLREALTADGELVLETLVIPGDSDDTLAIEGRYANMRNLYELPTVARLCRWLSEAGLNNPRVVDVTTTQCSEQRSTPWMSSHSLAQALNPDDNSTTIEGHPRPLRAIVLADAQC